MTVSVTCLDNVSCAIIAVGFSIAAFIAGIVISHIWHTRLK